MKLLKIFLIIYFLFGCKSNEEPSGPANVILVSKYVKIEKGGGTKIMDIEMFNHKVWIEGTIKNIGNSPATNIRIIFNVSGLLNPKLEDNISYLSPGESISFNTNSSQTNTSYEPLVELEELSFR